MGRTGLPLGESSPGPQLVVDPAGIFNLKACSLRGVVSGWSLQSDPRELSSELSFGVWPGCGFCPTLNNSRCSGYPEVEVNKGWLTYP